MNIQDDLFEKLSPQGRFSIKIWEPPEIAVVVGYSQVTEREVLTGVCRLEGVPIVRRRGGGGAVLLMPGILCLTCAFTSEKSDSPHYFFKVINSWIMDLLAVKCGITHLTLRGISDIALDDKKIFGCAMWKSRRSFLYQGSLLVNPPLHLFDRYLRHPSREPDYRQGRGHGQFVTSLAAEGFSAPVSEWRRLFQSEEVGLRSLLL